MYLNVKLLKQIALMVEWRIILMRGFSIMVSIAEFITYFQDSTNLSYDIALRALDDPAFCIIVKEYKDEEGNNLIHLVIQSFVEKMEMLYKPFQGKKSVYSHLLPTESAQNCSVSCLQLIKKLFSINVLPARNTQGLKPLDRLQKISNPYFFDLMNDILQQYVPLFENQGELYPGRKYVMHFNFFRNSKKPPKVCQIPDAFQALDRHDLAKVGLHERLALTEKNIRQGYISSAINLVIANLGFVVSDLPKAHPDHKPIFITIPICIDNYQCFAEGDLFSGTHSEAALCYVLKNKSYLQGILRDLKVLHPYIAGQKIYSTILDIHSTAEVCKDCQRRLHGLQSDYDETSFLKQLEALIMVEGYVLPRKSYVDHEETSGHPKLRLTIRASGVDNPSYHGDDSSDIMPAVFTEAPPLDIKQHPQKVFFHLPPSWNKYSTTSDFASFDDRDKMSTYKAQHRALLRQSFPNRGLNNPQPLSSEEEANSEQAKAEFARLRSAELPDRFPTDKLSFYHQTAFSNTGGKARSVHNSNIKGLSSLDVKDEEINDVFYGLVV